jgi:Fe-S cluster assembly ATPase SufC
LDYLKVDKIFVMEKGKIVEKWGKEIIEKIYKKWFE